MSTQINEISKVFLHGETLESSELNAIILQINTTIRKLNTVETNLDNHSYDVSIPITNIYCRTKKGINAINFFPQADAKRDELLEEVSNCLTTQGIKYNLNFSTITLSENADLMNGVWTAYPQGVNESLPHEWEVSYKKLADNSIMYMFGPVLRSNYGYSGADGDGVQYVYRVFDHELSDIERTNNTPTRPENPNVNGEFIPSGWTDDPLGPTVEYPYEYVATLKRTNGSWGNFEKISLWSTYTEDGTNGDFLVRAFCRFIPVANKLAPNTPIGGTYNNPQPGSNDNIQWSLTIPSEDNNNQGPVWTSTKVFKGTELATEWSTPAIEADSAELDIEYSSSLEKPDPETTLRKVPKTPHPSNNIWHDPSEANLDLSAMVWRAERKIKNGQYNGEWVITKIVGQKGSFKSMVFRRFKPTMLQSTPPIPTGGNYNNPLPDGGLWFDGIPSGDSKTNGPVWASTRIFYDDGTQSNWSVPQLLTDSEDLDIEFSPETTQPSNPTGEPFSNREASGWYDPSSINFDSVGPMIWRAERKVNNGQYVGGWTVSRILGEKGEEGKRGGFKSCIFKRTNEVLSNFNSTGDGATYESPIPVGTGNFEGWSDGIPAGDEILWMAVSYFTGEEDIHSNWTVTQQTDSVDLDIEFSPGEGSAHTCPTMSNSVFDTPIANYETNGDPPAITDERDSRNKLGWWDASLIDSQSPTMIWRAERKVHNLLYEGNWVITRILGEKGDPATLSDTQIEDLELAGLQIVVTPLTIILEQSDILDATHLDRIENVTSNIVVYDSRTGKSLTNDKYWIKQENGDPKVELYATDAVVNGVLLPLTPLEDYVSVTGADEINAKSITINNLPYINNNGDYSYLYDKGFVRVYLEVSVGTSRNTRTIKIDIPWYLNKLGERITKLKGDLESTLMSKTSFSNPNDPIISDYTASILDGADGRMANYGLLKSKTGGGYKLAFDANYILTAKENISKLNKSVTGTNLLSDNWTTFSSPVEITANPGVTIERKATEVSPQIPLSEGIYILSWYSTETSPNNFNISVGTSASKISGDIPYITNNDITWLYCGIGDLSGGRLSSNQKTGYEGDYYTRTENSSEVTYVRFYCKIIVNTKLYYSFVISTSKNSNSTYPVIRPQLELCLDTNTEQLPTPWTPGPLDFSSEIKQTADEITTELAGPGGSLSQVKQTLTNITSTVRGIQEGRENLILNGAFLDGTGGTLNWTGWGSPTTREIVTVDGKKWMHIVSTTDQYQGYLQQHSEDFNVSVIPGEKYTLSFRAYSNSGTANVCMGFHWKADPTTTTISSQNWYAFDVSTTPTIYSLTITIPSEVYYFNVMVGDRTPNEQNFYMTEIKFEKGEVATAWTPTKLDTYSQIKQTANEISLTVNGLRLTGIIINGDQSKIDLIAGKVNFVDSNGNAYAEPKISIDSETGTLYTTNMVATNGTFKGNLTGSLRNPVYRADLNPAGYTKDNIALVRVLDNDTLFLNTLTYRVGVKSSGRLIRFIAGKWGTKSSTGTCTVVMKDLNDDSKIYPIWEDGLEYTSFKVSNEVVELFGYGDKDSLLGFVVLNRIDFLTKYSYGVNKKILASGTMVYSKYGNDREIDVMGGFIFPDGTTRTIERLDVGKWKITFSHGTKGPWFSNVRHVLAEATGFGFVIDNATEAPSKATVYQIELRRAKEGDENNLYYREYIDRNGWHEEYMPSNGFYSETSKYYTIIYVATSDDASLNDGGFNFTISNLNDYQNKH